MFKNIANKIRILAFGKRFDDDHTLHYFSYTDYEHMTCEKFNFFSNKIKLQGYLYGVTPLEHKGTIIFVHGMGAGHIQYMHDIHFYCSHGYDVYTFDGQGCLNSEGDGLNYFSSYVRNCHDFIYFLKQKEELKNTKFILIGHSLGGHTVNVMAKFFKDDIDSIVSFSGFNNIRDLMEDKITLGNFLRKTLAKEMAKLDKQNEKEYSLSTCDVIKEYQPRILFIAGDEDNVVLCTHHFGKFKKELSYLNNTYFMLVKERHHNPYNTKESARYFHKTREDFNALYDQYKGKIPSDKLKEYYDSLDYKLMVELDEVVMNCILDFISHKDLPKYLEID